MRRFSQRPEVLIAAFYLLTFSLVLMPYYNWFYRIMANSLHAISFWLSPFAASLMLAPVYLYQRRFKRALLAITVGLLVVFAGLRVHRWRYRITVSLGLDPQKLTLR